MVEKIGKKWFKRDLIPVYDKQHTKIVEWKYGPAYDLQKQRDSAQWFDLVKLLNRDSSNYLDIQTRILQPLGKDENGNQIPSQVYPSGERVNNGNILEHMAEFKKWQRDMNEKYFDGRPIPEKELMSKIKELQKNIKVKTQSLQETYKRQVEIKKIKRELKIDQISKEEKKKNEN